MCLDYQHRLCIKAHGPSAQEEPWLFDELQLEGPRKRFLDRSNQNIGPPGMPTIAEIQSKRARHEASSAKSSASGSKGSKDRTNKDQDASVNVQGARKDVNLPHHLLLQKKQRLPSAGLQPTATKGQKTSAVEKPILGYTIVSQKIFIQ